MLVMVLLAIVMPAALLAAPLHDAAKRGDLLMVKRLLNRGADINQQDDETGATPLFIAVVSSRNEVVKYLLLMGARVNAVTAKGETILEAAALVGNVAAAELIGKHVADLNQADSAGMTPLDVAIFAGQRDYVKYLIDKGALKRMGAARMPLMAALRSRHEDVARLLIESGVGVGERDERGVTPLHLASYLGYGGVVDALLDRGAAVNAEDGGKTTPLFAAASGGYPFVVKMLLQHGAAVDHVTAEHNTALIPACSRGDVEVVRMLLRAGADPNIATAVGATPLIMAVQAQSPELVNLLLDNKADANATTVTGDTALTVAAAFGQRALVETLLQHGSHVDVVRKDGSTALDLAVALGDDELAEMLRAKGAVRGKPGEMSSGASTGLDKGDVGLVGKPREQEHPVAAVNHRPIAGIAANELPPEGYTWQSLPALKAFVLMPKGWHFLVENNDKVDAVFLTREDISGGGMFLTGLSINAMHAGVWSGTSPDAFARQEDSRLTALANVRVEDTWESNRGGLKQYGARYRLVDPEGHEHMAIKLTIVNEHSQSVYFVTFESPSQEWPAAKATGQAMLQSLVIDPEY